ncbi:hypothetical protein VIGAN_01159400 [Vigna angularis var. angularis]|uniref:Uncharacterized protein n=1 Tax=Vigna angularis var. angularis TaxID=157739 RepID=A0A0S3R088_PHAAN|nr:hypothetical protein VIGAN_01159400 [Vigna angularis var. angularis]
MIVALCLGDHDPLSNYDPLLFLRCCSIWWKIALIQLFTCLHVMFCLLRSSLSYHRALVKPDFALIFPCSSTSRLISDFRLPPYLTFSLSLSKEIGSLSPEICNLVVYLLSCEMLNPVQSVFIHLF